MLKRLTQLDTWLTPGLLLIVSALAYLPFINRLGYINDDWYLMYAGHSAGPSIFWLIFRSDRPLRAQVMGRAYQLFGDEALFYHLSAYLWRFLSGLAVYWLACKLWPRNRTANTWIALLFLLYPGFLNQVNPIDYQAHILSLFLAVFSIALTAQILQPGNGAGLPGETSPAKATIFTRIGKLLLWGISLVTGWIYLGLIEFYIGLEVLRLGVIALLFLQRSPRNWAKTLLRSLFAWLPFSLIPAGFLVWRLFYFQNERAATDVGLQLGTALSSTANVLERLVQLLTDTVQVIVLAWAVPFHNLTLHRNASQSLVGLGVAAVCVLCGLWLVRFLGPDSGSQPPATGESLDWRLSAIGLGLLGASSALIPVILANRAVDFTFYSRYALASSLGAVLLLVGVLYFVTTSRVRLGILSVLLSIAVLTHFANAAHKAAETASMNAFWWQVAWRAPQIQPETLLVAHYPLITIEEDYFVWGPANLIYYPDAHLDENNNTWAPISAGVLTPDTLDDIRFAPEPQKAFRRGIATHSDPSDLLVLSQPTLAACVRILNGRQPELSGLDPYDVQLLADHSRLERILTEAAPAIPPTVVFGPEPEHGWCYYYQKADLARQREDWETVAALGEAAWQSQFSPVDPVEYLPFLQAYAILDQQPELHRTIAAIKSHDSRAQTRYCSLARQFSAAPSIRQILTAAFCLP